MATTNFVDGQTVISADWLNDVDEAVYNPASISVPASSVTTTAISGISATDVQGVLAEIVAEKQPLDADLTAIAALTTATYGRSLLEVANEAALKTLTNLESGVDVLAYVAPGTSGNVLTSNGSAWTSAALPTLTLDTAKTTTSGTTKDFTIPSTAKRITVMLNGVSTGGTSVLLVQLGTGGVATTTGYNSYGEGMAGASMTSAQYTTGFGLTDVYAAARAYHGQLIFTHMGSNIWVMSGTGCQIGLANGGSTCGGSITLAGAIDFLRLTSVSGDTFDAGSVNIAYE